MADIHTTTNSEMPNSRLAGLRVDGEGRLWVITQDRFLMRYDDERFVVDGLPDDYIRSAYRDREGTLWVATNKGLARLTEKAVAAFTAAAACCCIRRRAASGCARHRQRLARSAT